MDKKYFKLNVPIGTRIISSRGDFVVEDVPDDAFDFFQRGSQWLSLEPEAVEGLSKLSKRLWSKFSLRERRQQKINQNHKRNRKPSAFCFLSL